MHLPKIDSPAQADGLRSGPAGTASAPSNPGARPTAYKTKVVVSSTSNPGYATK